MKLLPVVALLAQLAIMSGGCGLSSETDRGATPGLTRQSIPYAAGDEPAWKADLRRKLSQTHDFVFRDAPFCAIGIFPGVGKFEMVVDSEVPPAGRLAAATARSDGPIGETLQLFLDASGLTFGLIDHVVFVGTPERVAEMRRRAADRESRPTPAKLSERVRIRHPGTERRVTIDFADAPVGEALRYLGTLSNVRIVLDDRVAARLDEPVSMPGVGRLDAPLWVAIVWTARAAGLECEMRDDHVFVSTPERLGGSN